jgi:hypothetical protein
VKNVNENENVKLNEQEAILQKPHEKKETRRYTGENKKVTAKLNEQETGLRKSRGKKVRRNFRHGPERA